MLITESLHTTLKEYHDRVGLAQQKSHSCLSVQQGQNKNIVGNGGTPSFNSGGGKISVDDQRFKEIITKWAATLNAPPTREKRSVQAWIKPAAYSALAIVGLVVAYKFGAFSSMKAKFPKLDRNQCPLHPPVVFPEDGPQDLEYRQQWLQRKQCPVNLHGFVDFQREQKYFPKFSMNALKDLFGRNADLSAYETRSLYHEIIHTNRYICDRSNPFCVPEIVSEALGAADVRQKAREYVRTRTTSETSYKLLVDEVAKSVGKTCSRPLAAVANWIGPAKLLAVRDFWVHGTMTPGDPKHLMKKYAGKTEAETAKKIYEAAMKTNPEWDRLIEGCKEKKCSSSSKRKPGPDTNPNK